MVQEASPRATSIWFSRDGAGQLHLLIPKEDGGIHGVLGVHVDDLIGGCDEVFQQQMRVADDVPIS